MVPLGDLGKFQNTYKTGVVVILTVVPLTLNHTGKSEVQIIVPAICSLHYIAIWCNNSCSEGKIDQGLIPRQYSTRTKSYATVIIALGGNDVSPHPRKNVEVETLKDDSLVINNLADFFVRQGSDVYILRIISRTCASMVPVPWYLWAILGNFKIHTRQVLL